MNMHRIKKAIIAAAFLLLLTALFVTLAGAEEYQNGQVIKFGSYPQDLVKDTVLIEELNKQGKIWISPEQRNEGSGIYIEYADFVYDAQKYRAVRILSVAEEEQMPDGYITGETYYFKFTPVSWTVIDAEEGLVYSKSIIDSQYFDEADAFYSDSDFETFVFSWAESDIRAWLNGDFYDAAFSNEEKEDILQTKIDDGNTEDHVFLLSKEEYDNKAVQYDGRVANTLSHGTISISRLQRAKEYCLCIGFKNVLSPSIDFYSGSMNAAYLRPTEREKPDLAVTYYYEGIPWAYKNLSIIMTKKSSFPLGIRPALCLRSIKGDSCPEHGEEYICTRIENASEATCQHGGSYDLVVYCSADGEELYRDTINVAPENHDLVLINPDPEKFKCTSTEYPLYRCEKCGYEYTDKNPVLTHSFVNYVSNNDATCTTDGTKTAKCEYCDATDTITDKGSKLGHDYQIKVLKKAKLTIEPPGYPGTLSESSEEIGEVCEECSRCGSTCNRQSLCTIVTINSNHFWGDYEGVRYIYYTGDPVVISAEVKLSNGIVLEEGKDYELQYEAKTECGYGEVILDFKDNDYVEGSLIRYYYIYPDSVQNLTFSYDNKKLTVNWDKILNSPPFRVWLMSNKSSQEKIVDTNQVTFDNVDPSQQYLITFFPVDKQIPYDIIDGLYMEYEVPVNIPEIEYTSAEYTGEAIEPEVTVKNSKGKVLKKNTDYTLSYSDNTKVGLARSVVRLKGTTAADNMKSTYENVFRILPKRVSGLKVSSAGKESLKLSWGKVTGAEKYMLYQSADGKTWTKIKALTGNTVTLKGLKTGQTYLYKVRAYAVSGYGRYSAVLKAQTRTAAPTKLSVRAVSASSVKFKWNSVFGALKYNVYFSPDGKSWTKSKTVKTAYATVTGLAAGRKYYFRVTSVGLGGDSAPSAALGTGTLTSPPKITKLTSVKSKTAAVTWSRVAGAKSYVVYRSNDNKKWTKATTTAKLTYTFTKLTGGRKIYVKIAAVNAYGKNSACSAVKSVTVKK